MRLQNIGAYPPDWPAISRRVREEAGDRCIRCGHPSDRPGRLQPCDSQCRHEDDGKQRMLTVHHLDGDKSNCRWWNLLALCQKCHLKVQAKVIPLRPWLFEHSLWFRPYVAGFYAWHYAGLELTRDEAEQRLDELLTLGQPWRAAGVAS